MMIYCLYMITTLQFIQYFNWFTLELYKSLLNREGYTKTIGYFITSAGWL